MIAGLQAEVVASVALDDPRSRGSKIAVAVIEAEAHASVSLDDPRSRGSKIALMQAEVVASVSLEDPCSKTPAAREGPMIAVMQEGPRPKIRGVGGAR